MALIKKNVGVELRPIGSNGQVLVADSTSSEGVSWQTLFLSDFATNFELSLFTTAPSAVLVGQTISSGDLQFVFSGNEEVASGAKIVQGASSIFLSEGANTGYWNEDLVKNTVNASFLFTLSASGATSDDYDDITTTVTWMQNAFYGATGVSAYNSGFIHSLNSELSSNGVVTFSDTAASGEFIYYAFRSSVGTPEFLDTDTSIKGGFSLVSSTISFDNGSGYIENYQLWKSNQPALGSREITVNF